MRGRRGSMHMQNDGCEAVESNIEGSVYGTYCHYLLIQR
jgi:hypothetical protein